MKSRILCVVALAASSVSAAVSLPHVFGDNMVLQQGQEIPVWGKADPGERVTVSFAGQTVSATADASGHWKLFLAPLAASSEGRDFTVSSKTPNSQLSTLNFHGAVVGEVWFCSGQSNMEFPMGGLPWDATRRIRDSAKEIAAANHPLLRHFKAPRVTSLTPLEDVDASWEINTPETVARQSAVAYVFGETLLDELKVPVGLIDSSWGGSLIEPWIPAGDADDLPLMQRAAKYAHAYDVPASLWNGMVAGFVPYAIRGAIWYQGCANRYDGDAYLDKTVTQVKAWRKAWGQGDFPYFLVQLAPYRYEDPMGTALPVFQEMQARIPEAVTNSGYTVINDVGNVNDIHPTDKRTVGMRLADQVLDRVYGRFVRPWRTPTLKSARIEGVTIRVTLADADGLKTRDGGAPVCFEVQDGEGVWWPAEAKIEGSDVVLRSAAVSAPKAMRFAAHNGSTPNLVNGTGLPAGPFRWSSAKPVPAASWTGPTLRYVNPKPGSRGFVFAHRGGQKEHVENTMAAFAACYEAGIRGFETDVRMTKDGELVIHHDADTGRLFPVKVRMENLTLAEVKKLRTTEGNHPIPTLKEVLDYFADKPGCYIEFEMKASDKSVYPQELLEPYCRKLHDMVLKAQPKGSQYIFTCFADHVLETMRRIDPDCDMLAIHPGPADAAQIARCKRLNIRRLGSLITQTTREMIDECHRNGIVVSVWPGNTLDDYFLARGLGADGICQNRPESILRWRGEHEKPLVLDAGQTDVATGHVRGMLTAGNWNPSVKKRLSEVVEKNRGRKGAYAVFDFDYTMAIGDLSYTLIWHILEKEGRDTNAFWNEYRRIYRTEGDAAGVAWRSKVFERYSSDELTALAKEAIAADLKRGRLERDSRVSTEKRGLVFAPEMLELVRELRAAGITVYVVSGSRREALLAATVKDFGFKLPPECVFGANDGVVTGQKPAFIRKHIMPRHGGEEPVLVAGDSMGDYGMLTEFKKTKARLLFRRNWREKEMKELAASGDVLVQGRDETRGCYVPSSESVYP